MEYTEEEAEALLKVMNVRLWFYNENGVRDGVRMHLGTERTDTGGRWYFAGNSKNDLLNQAVKHYVGYDV